jgi:predicted Zn-dependent peptidase
MGYPSLKFDATGDYFKNRVANFVFGGAFNSRLNLNLREDKGYTYGIRSGFSGGKYTGTFQISSSVKRPATALSLAEIIKEFTKFTFQMHQKGVEFLDHSQGNTLIKDNNNGIYLFYLVDLNRMKFHQTIDFQTRMNNLSHLTPQKEMISIISNEYAKLSGEDEDLIFENLWKLTSEFQFRYQTKKIIKKKIKVLEKVVFSLFIH